jgi:nicotinamide-nucleotide amidase
MRRGEIIAIGSELLLGGRLDTNSLFLTEQLASRGVEVRFKSVVGDDPADMAQAIRTACGRAGVVVLTGGLGPTQDDLTREAVARVTGRALRRRAVAVEAMKQRLAAWGRTPSPAQLRQARIPTGAEVLSNPIGSAPGFALTWNGTLLVALPGVPAEAEQMFASAVAPMLTAGLTAGKRPARQARIERRLLHTFGLPESEVDEQLQPLVRSLKNVRLGLMASPRGVSVSFTSLEAGGAARLRRDEGAMDRLVHASRKRLGPYVFAEGMDTMEQVVGRALAERGWMLAVAESCTGGLIGHRLTEVPGSSAYLDRVAVCYSNRAKVEFLGVTQRLIQRHGAVSAQVAAAMARGIRLRSRAHVGLSVTGIAGPGGGTAQKPVGLVYIGLDATISRGRSRGAPASMTREFRFHGPREAIKMRASQAALDTLRQWLERTR